MSFIIVIQFIDYSNLIQIFYWLKLIYSKMAKAQVSNVTVVQIIELGLAFITYIFDKHL